MGKFKTPEESWAAMEQSHERMRECSHGCKGKGLRGKESYICYIGCVQSKQQPTPVGD